MPSHFFLLYLHSRRASCFDASRGECFSTFPLFRFFFFFFLFLSVHYAAVLHCLLEFPYCLQSGFEINIFVYVCLHDSRVFFPSRLSFALFRSGFGICQTNIKSKKNNNKNIFSLQPMNDI